MRTVDEQSMTLLCRQKKEEFSCLYVCVCASLLSTDEERERKDGQVKKESQEAEQKDEKAH
jgi:hypothetical protein